ncbi:hypothetical protein FOA43_000833 [Brettanomyces nanus]|uniref:Arrestin C-terminal-like domain-containing protein n=1 Tax=Eeniella nana TaxID=13502 RepID=A0A875S076_EENNA|nr:uncharacterized protein FOA43_000833 [Brettanomyces nanus]QPG73522.1 hypothetical protein FOA43_000833 [Brettanomyces nanus]
MLSLSRSKSSKSLHGTKSKTKTPKHTPLFDVRLSCADRDILILKGPPEEAPPVLLAGVVVLSVTEPINVKKLSLQLYATLNMHWDEKFQNSKGSVFTRPYRHSSVIFKYEWDPLNLKNFLLQGGADNYDSTTAALHAAASSLPGVSPTGSLGARSPSRSPYGSYSSLAGFVNGHQAGSNDSSSSSLASLSAAAVATANMLSATQPGDDSTLTLAGSGRKAGTSAGNSSAAAAVDVKTATPMRKNKSASSLVALSFASHVEPTVLPPGNYEFPFKTILQGAIPESIDSLKGCSLVYRLQSILERRRFSTPIITRRLIHVVRTLPSDSSELTETVAVDNTWPGKVDYSISVPTRALAVGSTCRVEITMVPLAKGLKLGIVKVKLAEYSNLVSSASSRSQERHIVSKIIPKVTIDPATGLDVWSNDTPLDVDGVFYRGDGITLSQDRWEIMMRIQIPASAAKITQDCDIKNSIKVRHKLKFSIGLINTDGHVSELRATLPVTVFISPFVPIHAHGIKSFDVPQSLSGYEDATVYPPGNDELMFSRDALSESLSQVRTSFSGSNLRSTSAINSGPNSAANSTANLPSAGLGSSVIGSVGSLSAASLGGSVTGSLAASSVESPIGSTTDLNTQDLMAPPSYDRYVYDRLCDANGAPEEPTGPAAPATPAGQIGQTGQAVSELPGDFNPVAVDRHSATQLVASLAAHNNTNSEARGSAAAAATTSSTSGTLRRPVFTLADETSSPDIRVAPGVAPTASSSKIISGPAFEGGTQLALSASSSGANLPALMSPPATTSVQHLSRATSFMTDVASTPHVSSGSTLGSSIPEERWDTTELSKVPSYETAIMSDAVTDELTPAYEPSEYDSHFNLDLLDSRLESAGGGFSTASAAAAVRAPQLSRIHSTNSVPSVRGLSPKFGSSTSLFSKQLHKLHRMESSPPLAYPAAAHNHSSEATTPTTGSTGAIDSTAATGDTGKTSSRPPVTPLGGRRSKSSLSYRIFHKI